MSELWDTIPGAFSFHGIYSEMIDRFDNATFIELGTGWGQSTSYMATMIKRSGKNIMFYTVDFFEPYDDNGRPEHIIFDTVKKNLESLEDYVTIIKGRTDEVCTRFPDNHFDFIFLDANHSYEYVKYDLALWYPKLKEGGVFAGHDWQMDDVRRAVSEYFSDKQILLYDLNTIPSWMIQ